MKRRQFKSGWRVHASRILAAAVFISFCARANAWKLLADPSANIAQAPAPQPPAKTLAARFQGPVLPLVTQVKFSPEPINHVTDLDEKRLYALGMVETGNNDSEVGAAGEV